MAITVNDSIQNNSPKSLDSKYLLYGMFVYSSLAEVNSTIHSAYRSKGLTVLVDVGGVPTEYWYREGALDTDLVLKVYDTTTASNLGLSTDGEGIFSSKIGNDLKFKRLKAGANITLTPFSDYIQIDGASPATGESNTASNLGAGAQVFSTKVGVDLRFRSLIAGSGVSISQNTDDVTISATGTGEINTASNLGVGQAIFSSKVGVDLRFKTLVAGTNITLSGTTDEVTVSANVPAGVITGASNVGTGLGIYKQTVSSILQFKTLLAGSGINLNTVGDNIEVVSTITSGETNTASNLGVGVGIFSTKVGSDLRFKSLVAGSNVTLTPTASDIVIDVAAPVGEINTGSNLGTTGARVFESKVGTDLRFRRLVAGSNTILTENANDITITSSASGIAKDEFTLAIDGTRTVQGEILAIRVRNSIGLSGLKIGTASLGEEVLQSTPIIAGQWVNFITYNYYETLTTFYFSGITSTTEIVIVTLNPGVGTGGSSVGYLDDLLDVELTTPSNGQQLVYDGTKWINSIPISDFVNSKTYTAIGGESTISDSLLINSTLIGVWRAGTAYEILTGGSPGSQQVSFNSAAGQIIFNTLDLLGTGEKILYMWRPYSNSSTIKSYTYTATGGELSFSNPLLIGKKLLGAFRPLITYEIITTGSPTSDQILYNSVAGAVTISTALGVGEKVHFVFIDQNAYVGDTGTSTSTDGSAAWGDITGTLSSQTDLQAALDAKANTSHTHVITDVTGLQTSLDGKASVAQAVPIGGATGQVLKKVSPDDYDAAWADDITDSGGATTLDSLTDVTITTAANGEVIKYDGTGWVNDVVDPQNLEVESDGTTGLEIWRVVSNVLRLARLNQGSNVTLTKEADGSITIAATGGVGAAAWGSITGTLSTQTDLQTFLDTLIKQGGQSFGANMVIGPNDDFPFIFKQNGNDVMRLYGVNSGTGRDTTVLFGTSAIPGVDGAGYTSRYSFHAGAQFSGRIYTSEYLVCGSTGSDGARFGKTEDTRTGIYPTTNGMILKALKTTTGTCFYFTGHSTTKTKTYSPGTYLYRFDLSFAGSNTAVASVARGFMINPIIDQSVAGVTHGLDEIVLFSISPTVTSLTGGTSTNKTAKLTAIEVTEGDTRIRNLKLNNVGDKLSIATGTNASIGTATLVAGTVTVSTTAVTASSIIMISINTPGGTVGYISAPAASIVAGTSFVINSTSATDTSTVNWWIIN